VAIWHDRTEAGRALGAQRVAGNRDAVGREVWHAFCPGGRQPVVDEHRVRRKRIAIPDWAGRVSPVFDAAQQVLVVDCVNGVESGRHSMIMGHSNPELRAVQLADWGVDVLVCGAVSQTLRRGIAALGIDVIDGVCGETAEVLRVVLSEGAFPAALRLPGVFNSGGSPGWNARKKSKREAETRSGCAGESRETIPTDP
jgi:predicted Fe-Mo cluster-binding NifX family protein